MFHHLDLRGLQYLLSPVSDGHRHPGNHGCRTPAGARPPALRHEKNYYGLLEKIVTDLGGEAIPWAQGSRCQTRGFHGTGQRNLG